jgi:hypothetical protein
VTVFKRVILYMARPPSMTIGRMGGCRGSKCRPKINHTLVTDPGRNELRN